MRPCDASYTRCCPTVPYVARSLRSRSLIMRIGYKVSLLVVGTAILATSILTLIGYTTARRQYMAGVDRVLTAAVAGLPRVMGDDYLGRALANRGLSETEYNAMV